MNSLDTIQDANGTRKVRRPGFVMCLFLLVSPAWGQTKVKPGFNLFSVEQDVEIGKQSTAEVEKQLPVLEDSMLQNYVARLGDRLARVVQDAKYPWNDYLRPVRGSTREQIVDEEPALSVKLSGRSPASGESERVVVVLRCLPNHQLVYLVFVSPEKRFSEIQQVFQPMLSSFGVNDAVFSR